MNITRLAAAGLVFVSLSPTLACACDDVMMKVKEKNDRIVQRDKSKPVRKALELQYAALAQAVENKDFEAFQALRTDDFHTVDEHQNPHTPEQMAERARSLLERIQPPIRVQNTIGIIQLKGNDAVATVRQYFSKRLLIGDTLRTVETYVTQDETWAKTTEGWKLRFVDGVRDDEWYIDGKRIDPTQPYDPEAPPYEPSDDSAPNE